MRFNELLGLMRGKLAEGERAYLSLFSGFSQNEIATTNHKDLQWKLAEQLDDLGLLEESVAKMRFDARELEKAFAELGGIIARTPGAMD